MKFAQAFLTILMSMPVHAFKVEVSIGEWLDKISILNIKMRRIQDEEKLQNVRLELEEISQELSAWTELFPLEKQKELYELRELLERTNEELWDIEDAIRDKEYRGEFDSEFIEIARSVYVTNDARCAIKRTINERFGSRLKEEKGYSKY